MPYIILIRGGGDLATGVALRLIRAGLRVVITEIAQPLAVRRTVAFAEAVYAGETIVEGMTAHYIPDKTDSLRILMVLGNQQVPIDEIADLQEEVVELVVSMQLDTAEHTAGQLNVGDVGKPVADL